MPQVHLLGDCIEKPLHTPKLLLESSGTNLLPNWYEYQFGSELVPVWHPHINVASQMHIMYLSPAAETGTNKLLRALRLAFHSWQALGFHYM